MTFSVNRIHVAEMFGLCTAGSLIYNLTVLNSFATNSLSSVGDTDNCVQSEAARPSKRTLAPPNSVHLLKASKLGACQWVSL